MNPKSFDERRSIRAAANSRWACAIEALESRLLLAGSPTPISVGNPSFESAPGVDGSAIGVAVWNISGSVGNAYNPASANYTNASDDSPTAGALSAPGDQKQVLFITGANSATQALTTTLAANTTYTLTVAVGNRGDLVMENFGIAVLAGGVTIASTTGDGESAPSFGFQDLSATSLPVPASSNLVGQPLTIQLSCLGTKGQGGQVNFDNVRLTSTVQSSPSVPSLLLTNTAFTPGTYNAGGTVTFSGTVSNQGDATVGSFNLAVGLTQDTGFINGNVVLLATTTVSQGLAPGQSVSVNVPGAVIPAGTADGSYFAVAQINSNVPGAVHDSTDTFQSANADIIVAAPPAPAPKVIIGGLDTSFGTGGIVRQSTPLTATTAVTAQPDGKTIAVGQSGTSGTTGTANADFCVTRFNPDGSLDTSFGQTTSGGITTPGTGSVITDFGGIDVPVGVVLQNDGRILVAGTSTDPANPDHSAFALARYNPDGSLDTGFGNGGMVLTTFATGGGAAADVAESLLLLADGRILVAGRSNAAGRGSDFAIARYNSNGSLDASFGAAGLALTDFLGGDDSANAVALDPRTGNLVAAGSATNPTTGVTQFALARFNAAGSLDTSFGSGGKVLTSINGQDDEAYGLAINSAGALFATGATSLSVNGVPTSDFATASYTASGALNRKFATQGLLTTDLGEPAVANQVSINRDGSLLVSGAASASLSAVDPTGLKVVLVQYTAAGRPDTTFGTAGHLILDLGAGNPSLRRAGIVSPLNLTQAQQVLALLARQKAIAGALNMLLIVAVTGTDTAIARVTPSGSALSNSITTRFPAIVLNGTKEAARVTVLNSGNRSAIGTASITLYASLDTSLDGSDIQLSSLPSAKLNLKAGRQKAFNLKFVIPASLDRGVYFLLSRLHPGIAGAATGGDNVAPTTAPVAIAPPFVDLAGAPLSTPTGLSPGSAAVVPVTIVNDGNVVARGTVLARALAAAGLTPAPTDPTLALPSLKVRLKPGAAKTYALKLVIPSSISPGAYHLLVTLSLSPTLPDSAAETLAGASALIIN